MCDIKGFHGAVQEIISIYQIERGHFLLDMDTLWVIKSNDDLWVIQSNNDFWVIRSDDDFWIIKSNNVLWVEYSNYVLWVIKSIMFCEL